LVHQGNHEKALAIQKRFLGKTVFCFMEKIAGPLQNGTNQTSLQNDP
jgi:hypothetical protein